MCYTEGCESYTGHYCKRAECKQPHCNEHKSGHMLAHTTTKLRKAAGLAPNADVSTEVLALLAKLRRQPGVAQIGTQRDADGSVVAWALAADGRPRREIRGPRVEEALHDLYLDLRAKRYG